MGDGIQSLDGTLVFVHVVADPRAQTLQEGQHSLAPSPCPKPTRSPDDDREPIECWLTGSDPRRAPRRSSPDHDHRLVAATTICDEVVTELSKIGVETSDRTPLDTVFISDPDGHPHRGAAFLCF